MEKKLDLKIHKFQVFSTIFGYRHHTNLETALASAYNGFLFSSGGRCTPVITFEGRSFRATDLIEMRMYHDSKFGAPNQRRGNPWA